MKRTIVLLFGVLAAVAIGGCSRSGSPPAQADTPRSEEIVVPVVEVATRSLTRSIDVPATVEGITEADLYAKIAGYVQEVKVDIGDVVEAGQELVRLAVPELEHELAEKRAAVEGARAALEQAQLAYRQAEAELEVAEAEVRQAEAEIAEQEALVKLRQSEFDRWQKLLEGAPALERRKLDEARYALESAQAALAAAKASAATARARVKAARAAVDSRHAAVAAAEREVQVAQAALERLRALVQYTVLRAPWPGRVLERRIHPGGFALPAATNSSAQPLLRLARVDRVRVVAYVPVAESRFLDVGDRVELHGFRSAPELHAEATVTRVAPAYEQDTRLMRAEIHLDNPRQNDRYALLPGSYGYVTITLERYDNVPTVPSTALLSDPDSGQSFVFVVTDDHTVQRRDVRVLYDTGQVAAVEGLGAGERVVRIGGGKLQPGQRVRPAAEPK